MTWLFSKALMDSVSLPCSPEPEAESLAGTCSDGEPYAQWNVMPTPQGFWRNDKMMAASRLSRFGPTLQLLTADRGEAVLTSFLEAFPVRTFPSLAEAKGSLEQDPGFGLSSLGSLARFDPHSSTWRTPQLSLLGGSELYSETWPRWGLMRNGECWVQSISRPTINASAFGLWPTPTVSTGGVEPTGSTGRKLETVVRNWPTPKANDAEKPGNFDATNPRNGLPAAVKLWPTATATAHKGWSPKHNRSQTDDRIDYTVEREASESGQSGRLNPAWVEWLMGWPIGWTELKPLAMARFQEWQQQHSIFLRGD